MTKLYIDNQLADMDPAADLSISLALESLESPTIGAVCAKSITIPATPHNRALMGECQHPCSAQLFNHSEHWARVEVRGCVVFEGRLHLICSAGGSEGYYRFEVESTKAEWRESLGVPLGSMLSHWSTTNASKSDILRSWKSGSLVRFLPVDRRTGRGVENFRSRILPENYHPFIHLSSLLWEMFAEAGYALESNFLYSDFFNSLYMSGRWSERACGDWKADMDFKAVRTEDSPTVPAHIFGRVFASPLKYFNSIGNLVDAPEGVAGDSKAGCFSLEESTGRICFTPTTSLSVAFDYRLRWRTQHRIKNRHELIGVSGVRFRQGDSEPIPLPNTNHDFRTESLEAGYAYNLIVFDHSEGNIYRLLADEVVARDENGETLEVVTHQLLTTEQRSTLFTNTLGVALCNVRLVVDVEGVVVSPLSDWAIYDGTVEEYGTTELDVCLRSHPVECSPTNPVYFDDFYFEGGEKDMEVTVLEGCSIQPVFYPHPPLVGEPLLWGDVANYSFTGMDLLLALQELFDLHIQTNHRERTVRIEPRRDFWNGAEIVDLSERVDLSEPIVVEELGDDHKQTIRLAYRPGDQGVEEWKEQSGEPYGEWSATIDNFFAKEGVENHENGIFTASVAEQGVVAMAPSASLIAAQDAKGSSEPRCIHNLNFLPKIVSFRGVCDLAEGEVWDYPQRSEPRYPLLTFFDNGSLGGTPCSLLFEDRDGVEGLHSWWDGTIETLNHSRRMTLRVLFAPEDIEQFVVPNWLGRNFGALYLLRVEGERVLCRLERICDYHPNAPSTRAVFVTI